MAYDTAELIKKAQALKLQATLTKQRAKQQALSGEPITLTPPKQPTTIERIFDVLSRGQYVSAGFTGELLKSHNPAKALGAAVQGLEGKNKADYTDVLSQMGIKGDVGKTLGFLANVWLDPTTYVGAGVIKSAGKDVLAKASVEAIKTTRETLASEKIAAKGLSQTGKSAVQDSLITAAQAGKDSKIEKNLAQKFAQPSLFDPGLDVREAGLKSKFGDVPEMNHEFYSEGGQGTLFGGYRDPEVMAEQATLAQRVKDASLQKEINLGRVGSAVQEAQELSKTPSALELRIAGRPVAQTPAKVNAFAAKVGERIGTSATGQALNKAFRTVSAFPGEINTARLIHEGADLPRFEATIDEYRKLGRGFSKDERIRVTHALENGTIGNLEPRLQDLGNKAKSIFNDFWDTENLELGIRDPKKYNPGFVPHIFENPLEKRAFKTVMEAKEAGAKPIEDIVDLVGAETAKHMKLFSRKRFIDHFVDDFSIRLNKDEADKLNPLGFVEKKYKLKDWKLPEGTYFHKDVAGVLDELDRFMAPDSLEAKYFVRAFDRINANFKYLYTSPNPGFHVRNLVGDSFLNWLDGVKNPLRYEQAAQVMRRAPNWSTKIGEGMVDADRIMQLYEQRGLRSGFLRSEVGRETMAERALGPAADWIRKGSDTREDFGRIAHFINSMKEDAPKVGGNLEKAADLAAKRIRKYNFDYRDLTPMEQAVFKRAVPFYTFLRKNMPLQMEMLFLRPDKLSKVPKAINTIERLLGADPNKREPLIGGEIVPEWVREMATVRLRGEGEGKHAVYLSPGLPFEDIRFPLSFLPGGEKPSQTFREDVIGGLSPVFKMPIEKATGRSLFSGAPITDNSLVYLTEQVPLARLALQRLQRSAAVKEGTAQGKFGPLQEGEFNWLTGLGARTVTPQRQLSELRRQQDPVQMALKELMKKYSGG